MSRPMPKAQIICNLRYFLSMTVGRSPSYVCPSCIRRLRPRTATVQRRGISQAYIQKQLEAKIAWAKQATDIRAGKQESMLTMLENRGYINQIIGKRDDLDRLMTEKRVGIYTGVDPTAPSLHVGHLLPLMVLFWAYIKGFHACSLLGGATAQIGDPEGRTDSRQPQRRVERQTNMTKMHYQLKALWMHVERLADRDYGYKRDWAWRREVTNNNAWLNKLSALELLKYLGQGVRLGTMLGRDSVKNRINGGSGMSFAEFTYPLLQSWDWWYMYETKGIQVQVGGADQFGNILAGMDAVNHIRLTRPTGEPQQDEDKISKREASLKRPMGFTVPLLTTASGEKFGKSAGNAIWLDREMTSPFDLYQFFLKITDADVHRYLKLFTFEPLDKLERIMEEHQKNPSKRVAQHKLAREVLEIAHGRDVAEQAEREHKSLFRKPGVTVTKAVAEDGNRPPDINRLLNKTAPAVNADNAPFYNGILPKSLVYNTDIARVIYHAGLVASRSEGHRMVANKGVYLGSRPGASGTMGDQVDFTPAGNWLGTVTEQYILGGDTLIIRVGKWKVKIIKIIDDEDFEAQGLTAPGWKEEKSEEASEVGNQNVKPWHKKNQYAKTPLHQKEALKQDWNKPLSSFVP